MIKLATGILVMISAVLLRTEVGNGSPRVLVAPLIAGLAGGFLGSTTSLSGVSPPAIVLAREDIAPPKFLSTLALYFVFSSGITLAMLAVQGVLVRTALFPGRMLWLPGALLGNFLGTSLGGRSRNKPSVG